MKLLPENILTKFFGALAILLFVLSSPDKSFIWHHPSIDYIEIATGEWESRSAEIRTLECASSASKAFGGRINFQNREGKNIGFIPFNIKAYGLLKAELHSPSFKDNYGTFSLEVNYRHRKSLNCYLTLDPVRALLPFDQQQSTDSFIALGAESQNREADSINLSISNRSSKNTLNLIAHFFGKDGIELSDSKIQLAAIPPNGRLIKQLAPDLLVRSSLIRLQTIATDNSYSAYLIARGLDEELYNRNYITTATVGSCQTRKYQISNDLHEEPLLEIVNVSNDHSRAFLSLSSRGGQKVLDESVLIPPGATYPFRIDLDNSSIIGGSLSISCDKGDLVARPSWQGDASLTLSPQENYSSISLPIIRKRGTNNIIRLNSESSSPSLIEVSLFSTSGEKLFTPFEQVELQGSLALPLDQHLGPKFEAVAVISSKKSSDESVRIALLRKEDSEDISESVLQFPEALLSSKERPQEVEVSKKIPELPDNFSIRKEKNLASLIADSEFDNHCIKRSRTAVPEAFINQDSLEFNLNLRKLLKQGVYEVKTFQILNKERLDTIGSEAACLSLLYANDSTKEELLNLSHQVPQLSFDFRKILLKGSIEKKLKLDGAAWLKAIPDNYLFCFRTAGDCDINQTFPSQYSRALISPNERMLSLKPSSFYPLLTIDRPYKPANSSKDFKIKAYIHAKVPYEILATVTGIKILDKNEAVNCKELNGRYRLHLSNNKWVSARQTWDRGNKLDLSLSYNPITFVHSQNSSTGPAVADNCEKFFKECNIGMWSVNVANGFSYGDEPHGWGRFTQKNKFAYRWTALPLLEKKELEFGIFEAANSELPKCDYRRAKVKLKSSKELSTLPEVIAKREANNTYLLPRKIYHPDTYPVNQPAPGIPYSVKSNLNPYLTDESRTTLATSPEMVGKKWLDKIPLK